MRTITTSIEAYKFDELNGAAKENALKNYNDDFYELPFLEDDIRNFLDENKNYFYDISGLQYSLSYSQGDGLSFAAKFDLKKFLDDNFKDLQQFKKNALCELFYKIGSSGNSGRYCYASKSDLFFDLNSNKDFENLENLFNSIFEKIQDLYMDLCKKTENFGYECIENYYSLEYFAENCDDNEYEFTQEGKMI